MTVFVSYIRRYVLTSDLGFNQGQINASFSSPIFGDMFLLELDEDKLIKKYKFSSPIFGDMFLLLILQLANLYLLCSFRLLYSEICSYCGKSLHAIVKVDAQFSSPIFGDMFLLNFVLTYSMMRKVFVSYIRRYVLTT